MTTAAVDYVRAQIVGHARLFFDIEVARLLQSGAVQYLPYSEAAAKRGRQIAIPTDLPPSREPESPWRVPFNGTTLTLWNPVPQPEGDGWQALPNDNAPVWYRHDSGTLLPAWNLFGNVFDLLTFGEEERTTRRDHHDRFAAALSPRLGPGLLEVPAVNEAVALLAAAVVTLDGSGVPADRLDCLSGAPVAVLSHDCDVLLGNDFWTQSVRLYRCLAPLRKLRLPALGNLWRFAHNAVAPRRYYFDNATGMAELERCFGYTSTYYLLNGSGGRFGARSRFSILPELLERIPPSWDVGIHYNYDTFMNEERFDAQLRQLQTEAPRKIGSGRAHYLKFDPARSFPFLRSFGVYSDESSGYPDLVGYRNGLAGCFQAWDPEAGAPADVWETPMVFMEAALVKQYGKDAVGVVERHLRHLSRIGGALTILVHPGQFFNPENRQMLGVYHELLKVCRRLGVVSRTARSLADQLRGQR